MSMKKNLFYALMAIVSILLAIPSCREKEQGGKVQEQEVKLTVAPKNMVLSVGKSEKISVIVSPKETPVSFTSSDEKIATVAKDGTVTAVAVGKCTITIKATDATEVSNVEVKEASKIDESRYIGIQGNEVAPRIYIPKQSEMAQSLELLKDANIQYGWVYKNQTPVEEERNGFVFMAPTHGKQYADNRLVFEIQYQTALKNKSHIPFINFFTRISAPVDPFTKAEHKQSMETLAKAYGFDEDMHYGKTNDGDPCLIAYNRTLGENEPLETKLYADIKDNGKQFDVVMQIAYRGPQK